MIVRAESYEGRTEGAEPPVYILSLSSVIIPSDIYLTVYTLGYYPSYIILQYILILSVIYIIYILYILSI